MEEQERLEASGHRLKKMSVVSPVGMLPVGRDAPEGKAPPFLGNPIEPAFYHLVLEHWQASSIPCGSELFLSQPRFRETTGGRIH